MSQIKHWLRRYAIRYFDLVDGVVYRSMSRYITGLEGVNDRLRGDLRWSWHRIDELNALLDTYREKAWRPALKDALEKINEEENHGRDTNRSNRA